MSRIAVFGVLGLALAWSAISLGCSKEEAAGPAPVVAKAPADDATGDDAAGDDAPDDVAALEIEKNLANLSPEDKELVHLQKTCPVSGEELGSMGPPIKVTKDGKSLFICCEGCQKPAEEKFAEFLAQIEEKKSAAPN
jgi:hypothetical protein